MSFEKDITSIMKLTEDNQLFKPASEDDKVARQGNELAILQAKFPVGCKVRTVGLLNTLVYGSNKGYTGTVDSYEKHGGNFKVNVKVSNDHPHSPHIFMEDPEDLEIVNESVKKVNEDNQLFKPASQEDLDARKTQYNRGNYKFLEYIVDPDPEINNWGVQGVGYDIDEEDSHIYFGSDGEPEFIFSRDTKSVIDQYLEENKELTAECEEHFEKYDTGGWSDHIQKWVVSKGGKVRDSGNTCNWDNSHYWGGIFEYTEFSGLDNKVNTDEDGVIIMMHRGGDYRGNYSYPIVYFGDFGEVISNLDVGSPNEEIAYMFGYDGDYKQLVADIDAYRNPPDPEADQNAPRHQAIPGQMNFRLERGENPAETYYESIEW